ncbi:hypothetical protein PGH42_02155 [Legionella pneumophila]|nr:hypothetical protein PGH42_02155 [Legionella pneumophila]
MNYQLELVVDTKLLEQQDKMIRDGIVNFNAPFTGSKPERYSIYVKDNENNIVGGAIVYAHKSSIYVDALWVSEKYRGRVSVLNFYEVLKPRQLKEEFLSQH